MTREEFQSGAGAVVADVFSSFDPFGEPFQPTVERRVILFPTGYSLGHAEMAGLQAAARAIGDTGFYEWMSEAAGHQAALYGRRVAAMNERTVEEHPPRLIAAADANPYAVPSERYLQTAFLSAAGRWGMIVSDEEHAVVGGTAAFIEALVESYPAVVPPRLVGQDGWYASENAVAPEDQVIEFIRAAPEWSNDLSRWLPKHLAHVYGPAAVDTLLARAGVV